MKHSHSDSLSATAPSGVAAFATTLGAAPLLIIDTLLTWQRRAEERRHLNELDDRLLKDMGMSRADAFNESRKPFWQT